MTKNLEQFGDDFVGDILRAGQKTCIFLGFQYAYEVDEFIDIESKNISLSLKYIQPQNYDDTVWKYDFAGDYDTFKAPHAGSYKIELWGAQGGPNASIVGAIPADVP